MSNSIWLVGLFPFLFHLHYQIFQYLCINHGSWFIKERNGMEIHAKLQFINGSNFVKIAKRRTKMTHVIPKWLDVSLFWQIQSVRILSNYQNECISGHMTIASLECILSNFIDGPVSERMKKGWKWVERTLAAAFRSDAFIDISPFFSSGISSLKHLLKTTYIYYYREILNENITES